MLPDVIVGIILNFKNNHLLEKKMRFESFIQALDMGKCEDQLQRQALFDLALLFVLIDGVVTDSEVTFMQQWLDSIPWNSELDRDEYYAAAEQKCLEAINCNEIEDFIAHRAKQLIDLSMKQQALQLANDISHVDGELDEKEAAAIGYLKKLLDM